VFGKYAGIRAAEYARRRQLPESCPPTRPSLCASRSTAANGSGKERAATIGREMRTEMFDNVGVFRSEEGLRHAVGKLQELRARFKEVKVAIPAAPITRT
jgi:succinate dehydrogenase / fumarate reductase, flavoprotein subunit